MFMFEKFSLYSFLCITPMNNHGNYVASLANLCRWLATQAEDLGVEIFPGFPASEILYEGDKLLVLEPEIWVLDWTVSRKQDMKPE